ncbi:hypothetical protein DYI37_17485 [Fulvimarina endophytica]|uniref:Divergent polysaccharide deacetylase family protein n=1 Tax=Fulvimarina endophytica TaxID=2293836 RepID=A0A371WYI8_9HYPH|nr:divergent polysaccharide deacetylase family protein [Fulvimarina endophytica]RFC62043.1 hypothetical protein DYI37_17485 [Fulvimarina endophytica]
MDSVFSQPLTPGTRSRNARLRPTRADWAIAFSATALAGLSLFPAWIDRADRQVAAAETENPSAALDPRQTSGISMIGGTAKRIDIEAALAARDERAAADTPYEPASFKVYELGDVRQDLQSAYRPEPDLLEESDFGLLPARSSDGRRPFDVYKAASASAPGPQIAIVVGGLGISQSGTQTAIASLPPSVTLGFAANGNSLDRWMQEGRRSGHELLLQTPMEPVGYPSVDPGENTVTREEMQSEDYSSLYASLARMTNYVGVMNYLGGALTADPQAMRPFLDELARRGLMYLDDGTSARSRTVDAAGLSLAPTGTADLVLDDVQDPAAIDGRLAELEEIARKRGRAIGVASAFEMSTAVISQWVRAAEGRGIVIVPVSALVTDPERG